MDKNAVKEYLIELKSEDIGKSSSTDSLARATRYSREIRRYCKNKQKWNVKEICRADEWVLDNYYLVEREAKMLSKSRPISKRILEYASRLLSFTDYELKAEYISAFFEVMCDGDHLTDSEVTSFRNALIWVAICGIRDYCRGKEMPADALILLIRAIGEIDFMPYVSGFSPIEKLFRSDPAGIYPEMDRKTQAAYKSRLIQLARRRNTPPSEYLRNIIEKASGKGEHIGKYLFKKKRGGALYISVLLVNFALIWCLSVIAMPDNAGIVAFCISLVWLIPSWCTAKKLTDFIASHMFPTGFIPKLKIDSVPDSARTSVVVTSLFSDQNDVSKLFDSIEKYYLRSGKHRDNLYFGILADLKESGSSEAEGDAAIYAEAERRTEALNEKHGDHFFCAVRSRRYDKNDSLYRGWERKRGALIEYVRLLRGKENSYNSYFGASDALRDIKYTVTLDSDTELGIGQIQELIGAMEHPLNKPVINDVGGMKRVTSGYGVMQPLMATSLKTAAKTRFSVLMCSAAGSDNYAFAAFDTYQSIFGRGLYCGKGIFDVDAYLEVLDDAFPENRILSHDIIEGARLGSALINDVYFLDSSPSSPMAYFKRRHRWTRGDIQSLPFAFRYVRNGSGELVRNSIPFVYKFALIDNLLRALFPASLVIAFALSIISARLRFAVFATGLFFAGFDFLLQAVKMIATFTFQPLFRNFFADVTSGIWNSFLLFLYNYSALIHNAVRDTDAVIRSVWRMNFSGKNLLEWQTADEAAKLRDGLLKYLVYMWYSLPVGAAFVFFSSGALPRISGAVWFAFPFISYFISKNIVSGRHRSESSKKLVLGFARDAYRYFDELVTADENYLPPDNCSFSPCEAVASRSSPTNIGLYLLSLLAARDMDLIDSERLAKKLGDTFGTLEKLPKYRGHLYNWYDNRSLKVIGTPYISTVDSGNFIACLIALKEGVGEYEKENAYLREIAKLCEKYISETNFRILYNPRRELFYIGLNTESGEPDRGMYDLYMSEARITSYLNVARSQVPKKHWSALGRTLISRGAHAGVASWSGTAFEYFMPPLLLPVYKNGFEYEALSFAVAEQKRFFAGSPGGKRVFGMSESGFFSFDGELNYQYRAFGIPTLSLRREKLTEYVISPYSSFLFLGFDPHAAVENLKRLKNYGLYGRYGFYEAIDFTEKRTGGAAIVKSCMAHHVGMSIIAALNYAKDDIFVRRFLRDDEMGAASILMEEKIPVDATIHKSVFDSSQNLRKMPSREDDRAEARRVDPSRPVSYIIAGRESNIIAASNGVNTFGFRTASGWKELSVPPMDVIDTGKCLKCMVSGNGQVLSTDLSSCPEETVMTFNDRKAFIEYGVSCKKTVAVFRLYPLVSARGYCIQITASGFGGELKTGFSLKAALQASAEYKSHPAFENLFMTAQRRDGRLIISRKSRSGESECAVCIGSVNSECEFATGEDIGDAVSVFSSSEQLDRFDKSQLLSPDVIVRKSVFAKNTRDRVTSTFVIACGSCEEEAVSMFNRAVSAIDRDGEPKLVGELSESLGEILASADGSYGFENELILRVRFPMITDIKSGVYTAESLWKYGISGDCPIVCYFIDASSRSLSFERSISEAARLCALHKLHSIEGIIYDLVLLTNEEHSYSCPVTEAIADTVRMTGSEYLLSRPGGVFVLRVKDDEKEMFRSVSSAFTESLRLMENNRRVRFPISAGAITSIERTPNRFFDRADFPGLKKGEAGSFFENGFLIDKLSYDPPASFSHIIAGEKFGTVVTHRDLGFTWWRNAFFGRISANESNAFDPSRSEKLYLTDESGARYDLIKSSRYVSFTLGSAEYFGAVSGIEYDVQVTCSDLPAFKRVRISLASEEKRSVCVEYSLFPNVSGKAVAASEEKRELFYPTVAREPWYGYMYCRDFDPADIKDSFPKRPLTEISRGLTLELEGERTTDIIIGASSDPDGADEVQELTPAEIDRGCEALKSRIASLLPRDRICEDSDFSAFYNFWLSYQTVTSRLFGRTGLYQSSGANGFRDQLQDSLLFLENGHPEITRSYMLRFAAHQFEEGDCQHWWHDDGAGGFGARTRCSDDYLWLVYVALEYLEKSGDYSVLDEPVSYLSAPALAPGEEDRCFSAGYGDLTESFYHHLLRAVNLFVQRGVGSHGQPFMGSGDWNDGMNMVGKNGGESVWLGFFGRFIIEGFAPLARERGDTEAADRMIAFADSIDEACEKYCYNGSWYARAFYGDGRPLGSDSSLKSPCSIDILPQAWAVFCYERIERRRSEAKRRRMLSALESVRDHLFDRESGVVRLFAPGFGDGTSEAGYIGGYVPGVRENSGQYTHAAVWYALALDTASGFSEGDGMRRLALEIMDAITPAQNAFSQKRQEIYKGEPYVMAGDVYFADGAHGRGGWSWYTGSAAWFYRAARKIYRARPIDKQS